MVRWVVEIAAAWLLIAVWIAYVCGAVRSITKPEHSVLVRWGACVGRAAIIGMVLCTTAGMFGSTWFAYLLGAILAELGGPRPPEWIWLGAGFILFTLVSAAAIACRLQSDLGGTGLVVLRCRDCGYLLRGLSATDGRVRCPECGCVESVREIQARRAYGVVILRWVRSLIRGR